MLVWISCPICTSDFTVHIQDVMLQRQNTKTPQYYCMSCESFFHTSNYHKNESAMKADLQWLVDHPDQSAPSLIKFLKSDKHIKTVYEAGCGAGEILKNLKAAGFNSAGIDPNPSAVAYAVQQHQVAAKQGLFSALAEHVDAVISIDVMEHLSEPRKFFTDLVASVRHGGLIIVRVPCVERSRWKWLRSAGETRDSDPQDPFCDNSVHITHFSKLSLINMAKSLGADYDSYIEAGDYHVFRRTL